MMKLIDASRIITADVYDDCKEEWNSVEMTIEEFLDRYTNEGCPEEHTGAASAHGRISCKACLLRTEN